MAFQPGAVANAVEVLRKRIQQIRERREIIGEENTKATLIDPLLEALGWGLREIDEVRREYRRKPQDNPVDYALFLNRTECLFIEAKSLEKDLSDHKWVTQNLSYATGAGVQWCVLTNGDEYRIYNAHAPVAVIQRKASALSAADIRASLKRARIRIDFPPVPPPPSPPPHEPTLENLIAAGLIRPTLELERDYKGVHLVALIQQNGKVEFAGEQYDSLSTAAGMARKTVIGSPPDRPYPQTNGWTFWQYRDKETGELREMDYLRQQYLAAKK
jgi:hypothetical protein